MTNAAPTTLEAAFAAFDSANATDPRTLRVRGVDRPFALGEAELATAWLAVMAPDAAESLRLAVRAHHLRRFETPRVTYPQGRAGYLRWRKHLYDVASGHAAAILRDVGYDEDTVARVVQLMHKRDLQRDADAQTYEDVLCLVFLESQFGEFAARMDGEKLENIVAKTLAKMSDVATAAWATFQQL
ncbi:MAG TPA: DUF4202 domain-containing protein [Acidimicrobiales bacterium]|nr:DUF4202 domain-containing protein [Acidimicrobiales bacterium]